MNRVNETTLKVNDAAQRLNVSASMVYKMIAQGQLAHVRIGRCVRVPAEEVDRIARESVRFHTSDKTKRGKSRANPDT